MTLLCAAALGDVPGVRPCPPQDHMHLEECADDECQGCYPHLAEVGLVCERHYGWVKDAVDRWPRWFELAQASGGRLVTSEGGGGQPLGYVPLAGVQLAIDECARHKASQQGRRPEVWLSDEDGARDGLLFARAAFAAYSTYEVEPTPAKVVRVPCPHCGEITIGMNRVHDHNGWQVITCIHCAKEIDRVRDTHARDSRSERCRTGRHVECEHNDGCQCVCHDTGPASLPRGIPALSNGDLALTGWVDRTAWVLHPDGTVHEITT